MDTQDNRTYDKKVEEYRELTAFLDLLPVLPSSDVGAHVWSVCISDEERDTLRGLAAKLASAAEDPEVLRQSALIVGHLLPTEREAFASFVAHAIERTQRHIDFANRALNLLNDLSDQLAASSESPSRGEA